MRVQSRHKARPPTPVELVPIEGRDGLVDTTNPTFTPDEPEVSTVEVLYRTTFPCRMFSALLGLHILSLTVEWRSLELQCRQGDNLDT